jgi:hypothetical protein
MVEKKPRQCAVCGHGDDDAPLVALSYRGDSLWICPQHMPALIHDPGQLSGLVPGAENLTAGDHDD